MSKKAKSISIFKFPPLYTSLPHKLLLKVLSEVINFVFKSKVKKPTSFSKTSIYWTYNEAERGYFTKQTLADAIFFLTNKCFFIISNMVFIQHIGIATGICDVFYHQYLDIFTFVFKRCRFMFTYNVFYFFI